MLDWKRYYDLFKSLEERFDTYKKRLLKADNVSLISDLKTDLGRYSIPESLSGDVVFKKPLSKLKKLQDIFDNNMLGYKTRLAIDFKNIYKSSLKRKETPVIEKKKSDLFAVCVEYESLSKIGLFDDSSKASKKFKFDNKKIKRFSSFYKNASKINDSFEKLVKQYASASSKDDLEIVLDKAIKKKESYFTLLNDSYPFLMNSSSPYNCDKSIDEAEIFIKSVKKRIKTFDNIVSLRESISYRTEINHKYASLLSSHYNSEDVKNFFPDKFLFELNKPFSLSKDFNDPMLESCVKDYRNSISIVNRAKSSVKDYIVSSSDSLSDFGDESHSSLDECFNDLEKRFEGVDSLRFLSGLVGKGVIVDKLVSKLNNKKAYLTSLSEKKESIVYDINSLQKGETIGLTKFQYAGEKKNPLLNKLVIEYESLFEKVSNSKKQEDKELREKSLSNTPLLSESSYNLGVNIRTAGMPPTHNLNPIRNVLIDDYKKTWVNKFDELGSICEELNLASTHGEVDYLKVLGSMIEKSTTRGVVHQEIIRKKDNKLIVQNALNSLYDYIARSEQNIAKTA